MMMSNRMTIEQALESEGCWIDGHWGQYGVSRMVRIAAEHGYNDRQIVDIAARHLNELELQEVSVDDYEILSDAAVEVEAWLNEHVAPEGYSFGWHDGEFFLMTDEWWEEEA